MKTNKQKNTQKTSPQRQSQDQKASLVNSTHVERTVIATLHKLAQNAEVNACHGLFCDYSAGVTLIPRLKTSQEKEK